MISFMIQDVKKDIVSNFSIDYVYGKSVFSGFTIRDNKLCKLELEQLKILNYFNLGKNGVVKEESSNEKVILDLDTGLFHYFENGKENLEKLLLNNGRNDTMAIFFDRLDSNTRNIKYVIANGMLAIIFTLEIGLCLSFAEVIKDFIYWEEDVNYNAEVAHLSFDSLFSGVKFTYDGETIVLDRKISSNVIKNYIYDSVNLSDEEKNFIWNEELINDVISFYKGTSQETLTQVRHFNLGIDPYFNDDGRGGWYLNDNLIHIFDYKGNLDEGFKQILGHEYVHLLQCSKDLYFIRETSAEIITHEYFLNSSDTSISYSYSEACKRLRVLMEIIGPDVIWDYDFNLKSTKLQDTLQEYLSNEDYEDIISIFSLSPFNDIEQLNCLYTRLDELLGILYFNKFGEDISNNKFIYSIMSGVSYYNRPYFRKSLIEKDDACFYEYPIVSVSSVQDEIDNGNVCISVKCIISEEDFNTKENEDSKDLKIESGSMEVVDGEIKLIGSTYDGTVILKDSEGEKITKDIHDAFNLGYVNVIFLKFYNNVSVHEFLNFLETGTVDSYDIFYLNNDLGLVVDDNGNFISKNQYVVNHVSRIDENVLNNSITK